MQVELIFSNKRSELNKKLIKFFNINMLSLNKAALIFNFEVAHPEDMEKYVSRGVKNYPVLINNDVSVTGVEKIIQYLKLHVKKHNERVINKPDSEKVSDFWKSTLGKVSIDSSGKPKVEDDDDDDNNEDENLHRKIQKAFEDRSSNVGNSKFAKSSQKPKRNNIAAPAISGASSSMFGGEKSPAETIKSMNTGNSKDDELMAKFFENQEESV